MCFKPANELSPSKWPTKLQKVKVSISTGGFQQRAKHDVFWRSSPYCPLLVDYCQEWSEVTTATSCPDHVQHGGHLFLYSEQRDCSSKRFGVICVNQNLPLSPRVDDIMLPCVSGVLIAVLWSIHRTQTSWWSGQWHWQHWQQTLFAVLTEATGVDEMSDVMLSV